MDQRLGTGFHGSALETQGFTSEPSAPGRRSSAKTFWKTRLMACDAAHARFDRSAVSHETRTSLLRHGKKGVEAPSSYTVPD